MNLPGYRLHLLKEKMLGLYAIDVASAWRLTFEFDDGDAIVVDYEQYLLEVNYEPYSYPQTGSSRCNPKS